jgi:tRNA G18 (ribose-2'-O)-methylase SpoU
VGPVIAIHAIGDERVGDYRSLSDAARLRNGPAAPAGGGTFIVEGTLAIRELIRSRYPVRSVLVTPERLERLASDLAIVAAPVYVASRATLAGVAGFDVHRGALASAGRLDRSPWEAVAAGAELLAVVEGVNDHENLGALFRNAAAFGVGGVLLCPRTADPLYRRSVRVSVGHVLHVPWTRLDPWPAGLLALRSAGFELIALTPNLSAIPLLQVPAGGRRRRALLLGAEGPGLSEQALAASHRRVRIPMAGGVDSLNVATAAAIAFHHFASSPEASGPTASGVDARRGQ